MLRHLRQLDTLGDADNFGEKIPVKGAAADERKTEQ